ncbi:hypothetical protein FBZ87_103509 [Nitrospirillum amazonense]|uniref:Uncharacterized protein n=1 Tax=Nitrospirillum amazonense TaxID=28077 RepID=A0A560KAM6_9PROT|nr:hypothetical protein [Nitrospirillum amazonense]TWB77690.1 hypothetical protein FBZ87_103509 [Nitrospirillum amazonense]
MDLWPDAPSPTDPDSPSDVPTSVAAAALSPFEIAGGAIDLAPSPSERRAAAAMMRAAYALSAQVGDRRLAMTQETGLSLVI